MKYLYPLIFRIADYSPDRNREPRLSVLWSCPIEHLSISSFTETELFESLFWCWASGGMTEKQFAKYLERFGMYPKEHRLAKRMIYDQGGNSIATPSIREVKE